MNNFFFFLERDIEGLDIITPKSFQINGGNENEVPSRNFIFGSMKIEQKFLQKQNTNKIKWKITSH